jgi:type I restriction enzyme S subunit
MFQTDTFNREGYNILIGRFALSLECVRIVNEKLFLNDSGLSIKSNTNILNNKYLGYYLLTIQQQIYNLANGVAQKNLNIEEFNKIKIPVPSLEQQEEVIKTIEDINNLIEYRRTLNENNKKEKKYLLDDIKNRYLKNRNNYEFGELFDLIKGKNQSSKIVEDPEGDAVFINLSKTQDFKNINSYELTNENLFISNVSPIGLIQYYEGNCTHINIKEYYKYQINIKFIYYLLLQNQKYIEDNFQKGLANKSLDVKEFNKIKIPVPSLEQQEEFIREVEELNTTFEKIEKDNNYIIDNLENIKKEIFK